MLVTEQDRTGYPSIDKPWLKFYSSGFMDEFKIAKTVYQYVEDNNREHLIEVALKYKGKDICYKELFDKTNCVASSLKHYGLKMGDRIMMAATGVPEVIYILLACSKLGICVEMINFSLDSESIKNHILNSDAKLAFCLDRIHEKIKNIIWEKEIDTVVIPATQTLSSIIRFIDGLSHKIDKSNGRTMSYDEFIANSSIENITPVSDEGQPYVVVYTSGTTGMPKGIVHTNRSYTTMAEEYRLCEYSFGRGDCFLNQIPFFIASALSFLALAPVMLGVTVILEPTYESDVWLKDICKYKPEVIFGTQSFWNAAVESGSTIVKDLSFANITISGGEPITIEAENKVNCWLESKNFGSKLTVGYGMSELNGTITTSTSKYHKVGATGIPLPDVLVGIFDTVTGDEKKYGQLGELMAQSPCAMKEYANMPDKTKQYWWTDSQGRVWARTGDVGCIDENGEVSVYGRAMDSIKLSDKTVYFFEIESMVQTFEGIKKCKVVETTQGLLRINVVVSKDIYKKTDQDVIDALHDIFKLNKDKLQIKEWEEFPLNANGKVDKVRLKKD